MATGNGQALAVSSAVTTPANEVRAQHALEPTDIGSALDFARVIFASGLAPKALRNFEAVFTVIARGRELKLTAMQALASIHLVEGKTVMSADLMVALVRQSGMAQTWHVDSHNDRCTVTTQRIDDSDPTVVSFTAEDAKRAGLLNKDNWTKYPRAMLRARAISEACRMVYPDVLHGCYETDELTPEPPRAAPTQAHRRIETTIIRAEISPEKAAPKPTTVEDQETDVTEALLASDLLNQIRNATNADELKAVGKEIAKHKLSDRYRVPLRQHYADAEKALAKPANPEDDGR